MRTYLCSLLLLLALPACGLSQQQVDTFGEIHTAAASEYRDLSESFYSWCEAVESAAPADSVARAKAVETKLYIVQKDARFTGVMNDMARAIVASKSIDGATKQELLDDLFALIASIKAKGAN